MHRLHVQCHMSVQETGCFYGQSGLTLSGTNYMLARHGPVCDRKLCTRSLSTTDGIIDNEDTPDLKRPDSPIFAECLAGHTDHPQWQSEGFLATDGPADHGMALPVTLVTESSAENRWPTW